MVTPCQCRRLLGLTILLISAFFGLGYRLVDLQVLRHQELNEKAEGNTRHTFLREPRRGEIRDIRGNVLVTSLLVKTVCADPVFIGSHQAQVAHAVAPILNVNEQELAERLRPRVRLNDKGESVTNRYVVLKRKVRVEQWKQIQEAMTQLSFGVEEKRLPRAQRDFCRNLRQKAIFTDPCEDQLRVYPSDTLAAHALGYVGMVEREVNGTTLLETVGKDGIERTFDAYLRGVRGWRLTETDRRRHEVVAFREQDVEPRAGFNVVLTLDAGLQHIVESELAEAMKRHSPVSASAIVMRPQTGEILSLATLPSYDPANPGASLPATWRNRVISDIAEPGSTFKIVVVSAALNDRLVTLNDRFDCENGRFAFRGKVLHDHEHYGVLNVETIITKSSNIGAAKIGIKLGEDRLYQYMRGFGFGEPTGIPLVGEVGGIVHPVNIWSKLSISRIPMGHEVAVTPLQMVMAMGAIANQGVLMRPMLVDRLEDDQGQVVAQYRPQKVRAVISPEAARQMVTALKTVVTGEGTAQKAGLENFVVAGKTGTAQKAGLGGYLPGKYFASFIGFFPADAPELCISVVLDEPQKGYYGGQTAAPIFRNIAERAANYLSIRPDRMPAHALTEGSAPRPLTTASSRRRF